MAVKDMSGFAVLFICALLTMMLFDAVIPLFRYQHSADSICNSSKFASPASVSFTKSNANAKKNPLKVIVSKNLTSTAKSTRITEHFTTPSLRLNASKKLYFSLFGRFGNMLFEFTGLYALMLETKSSQMYFQENGMSYRIVQMFPNAKHLLKMVAAIPPGLENVNEHRGGEYDATLAQRISAAKSDVSVGRYLSVSQYWKPKYEKEIKDVLTISKTLKEEARKFLFDIAKKKNISLANRNNSFEQWTSAKLESGQPTLVGIQVRRGDKVDKDWALPDNGYFARAMDHFRAKYKYVYFIVVSEDVNWAQKNIVGPDVVYSTSPVDILELTLLSLCDHTIMSVGTFSWLAAYLAGGDVVYFKDHMFKHSPHRNFYNDAHYFLPNWKPML